MPTSPSPPLGPLVRLLPLNLASLPAHPSLPSSPSRPSLATFLSALLSEALTFADHTLPQTFHLSSSSKRSPPATSPVALLKRQLTPADLAAIPFRTGPVPRAASEVQTRNGEAWFARRSRHAPRAEPGTASWAEFDEGLRVGHSEKERMYTPDVYDSYRVLGWEGEMSGVRVQGFEEVEMSLYEMCHELPAPLKPRVFSVVVVTAKTAGEEGLLVVQVPVDAAALGEAMYSNGRNEREGGDGVKRKRCVRGMYVSVERARVLDGEVEWVMATASDAGGWLPMWSQKMGVPGAVVKDVGLFIKWVGENRGKEQAVPR
ncbi:hypothetical protein MMC13_006651 [Lambiella insularis]|nr:hypothetical protein [Lambiella insularis]